MSRGNSIIATDRLRELVWHQTSLVIPHRLSTIQHCDEICVIVEGAIVERGTHAELFAKGGHYRRLCDMQAFD
ncbi:MAG: hypothetical protein IPK70_14940 [Flavobacteriales bacterium]|nr:hypothetical protein [Flavobacteriales bacterium]